MIHAEEPQTSWGIYKIWDFIQVVDSTLGGCGVTFSDIVATSNSLTKEQRESHILWKELEVSTSFGQDMLQPPNVTVLSTDEVPHYCA